MLFPLLAVLNLLPAGAIVADGAPETVQASAEDGREPREEAPAAEGDAGEGDPPATHGGALPRAGARLELLATSLKLDMTPLALELQTMVGEVRLEFLSLPQLEFKGTLASARDLASPEAAPAALFDRTDVVINYVLSFPVATF